VKRRREIWFEAQPDLDPERLVFIDETGVSTKMARLRGRTARGERCRAPVPHGHWKTTTFVGALRLSGITAPMTLGGAMNGIELIKALLKKAAARTVEDLWAATATAINAVTPAEARNYFAAAGYEPE